MSYTFNPSARQQAGLEVACAWFNATNETALSPGEYLTQRVSEVLDNYADHHAVGLITPYEFVERFQRIGVYEAIYARSLTDVNVANYLGILRAKRDNVNLFSPTVAAGLGYLVAVGALTQAQADQVVTP